MRLLIILLFLFVSTKTFAEDKRFDCSWDDDPPCIVIPVGSLNNSNALGDRITPTTTITKTELREHNLIDLPSVLDYVATLDVTQSGPRGQNGSIFLRGTNSNHTLVLLNGIPINDTSTPTGAFDVGQDFMFNVVQVDVYKGGAGAHWGADAVGGAINFITAVDYDKRYNVSGNGNDKTISGNYYTRLNDFDISVSAGEHESKNVSALSGADEKDGTKNQTIGVNVSKWYDMIHWRTSWFTRNTFTDIDGHSLAIQDDKWADNSFYAFQTGIDYFNNSLTFHTHEYERIYDDANYDSQNWSLRGVHQRQNWGLGFDYKHDENYGKSAWSENTGRNHGMGYFFNFSYNILSYHHRFDEDHETYKIGFLQELDDGLSISGSHSTSYKDKTLYSDVVYGDSQEVTLTKNNFATTIFQNDIGDLNTNGVEMSYNTGDWKLFASNLTSKTKDVISLRRPEWSLGFIHNKKFENNFTLTTNYKYKGKHLDIHNSNWSTISMPETHLVDLNLGYNYHGFNFGVSLNNLLNEKYESPHGFSQEGRKFTLGFNKSF